MPEFGEARVDGNRVIGADADPTGFAEWRRMGQTDRGLPRYRDTEADCQAAGHGEPAPQELTAIGHQPYSSGYALPPLRPQYDQR